jgi:signal transduction histidine kinase
VFDIGFTLKANGTGLGLSIAREAIGRSGGSIDVLDTDEGACFRITIPRGD